MAHSVHIHDSTVFILVHIPLAVIHTVFLLHSIIGRYFKNRVCNWCMNNQKDDECVLIQSLLYCYRLH